MITQYPITATEWTAITSAGQHGSCWLDEDGDGTAGTADVRVINSASGVPALSKATEGKRVFRPAGNGDYLEFSAEGSKRIQIPQQPSGTRISCRVSDSTAGTITVGISFEGHYYAAG